MARWPRGDIGTMDAPGQGEPGEEPIVALRGMPALFSPPHRDVPRTTHSCGLTCESNGFPPVWFWGCGLNSFRLEFLLRFELFPKWVAFRQELKLTTATEEKRAKPAGVWGEAPCVRSTLSIQ
jgi:hypothetical protein